jgi:hypothetical protein
VISTASAAGFDGLSLGSGFSGDNGENMGGKVVALSSTEVGIYGSNFGNTFRGLVSSAFNALNVANHAISFSAQIPLV